MISPIALFDLDCTLAEFDDAMRREWCKIHPHEEYQSDHTGEAEWSKNTRDMIKRVPGFWRNLNPSPLGFDLLDITRHAGFIPHILTAASLSIPTCWSEKIEWCQEHIPGVPVTITRDKSLTYGALLVDDWPEYIEAWLAHRPRGIVLCPAQPWNKNIEEVSSRIIRVPHNMDYKMRNRVYELLALRMSVYETHLEIRNEHTK